MTLQSPGSVFHKNRDTAGPKSDNAPLFSVIIPTYNSAAYIAEAIESVLVQTYQNFEIVVVDDGSTDGTRAILVPCSDRITYLSQANRGPSAARNLGIQHSRGELIGFLDADDIWLPNKLERQLQFMVDHMDVALVFGDVELFNEHGTVTPTFLGQKAIASRLHGGEVIIKDAFRSLLRENFITTTTVTVRRSCLREVGGFDELLRSVEDRDLWLRIAGRCPIGCVPEIVGRKRVHGHNISSNGHLATQSLIRVLEKRAIDPSISGALNLALREQLAHLYFLLGYSHFDRQEYHEARQSFRWSLARKIEAKPIAYYLATLLGTPLVTWARRVKRQWRRTVFLRSSSGDR